MVLTSVIRISGRVQGVGFRYTALNLAVENAVMGYVENDRYTKDVILHCQGDPNIIDKLLKKITSLNGLIRVDKVVTESCDEDEYNNFSIR
jgi:acylphosphatase